MHKKFYTYCLSFCTSGITAVWSHSPIRDESRKKQSFISHSLKELHHHTTGSLNHLMSLIFKKKRKDNRQTSGLRQIRTTGGQPRKLPIINRLEEPHKPSVPPHSMRTLTMKQQDCFSARDSWTHFKSPTRALIIIIIIISCKMNNATIQNNTNKSEN